MIFRTGIKDQFSMWKKVSRLREDVVNLWQWQASSAIVTISIQILIMMGAKHLDHCGIE